MAEFAQLRKLGRLLDDGKREEATKLTVQMLRLQFSNLKKLVALLDKYEPLDIAPFNTTNLRKHFMIPSNESEIIKGDHYFPYIAIASYEVFDNYYFMGYHTYIRGHILYDFKISRGYFIVSKYMMSIYHKLTFIGGIKRQFDALYAYCNVTKPNYYLDLAISEEGPELVIKVSYKERPIITVIYSNAASDRLRAADICQASTLAAESGQEAAGEYPAPDHIYDPVKIYGMTQFEHWSLSGNQNYSEGDQLPDNLNPVLPILPYEREIIIQFEQYIITSYYNAHYSKQKKSNYCHSFIKHLSED